MLMQPSSTSCCSGRCSSRCRGQFGRGQRLPVLRARDPGAARHLRRAVRRLRPDRRVAGRRHRGQRVTPASRTALLLGRVLRDVVVLLVQGTLLVLVLDPARAAGAVARRRPDARWSSPLLGAAFASVSYALALTLKSEDALAPLLNVVMLPVLLLSGILLPMTLGPAWLQTISDVNPLKHVVEGTRAFFLGGYDTSIAWWGARADRRCWRCSGGCSASAGSAGSPAELAPVGLLGRLVPLRGDTPGPDRGRRHALSPGGPSVRSG